MVETIWNHEVGTLVGVEPPQRKMEASNFRTRIVEWLPRVGSVGVLTHRCFLGRARISVDFGGAGRPGWHDLRLGRRAEERGVIPQNAFVGSRGLCRRRAIVPLHLVLPGHAVADAFLCEDVGRLVWFRRRAWRAAA